jgi:hypothetical protein
LQIAVVPGPALNTPLAVTWNRNAANASNLIDTVAGAQGDLVSIELSKSAVIAPSVTGITVTVELG